MYISTITLNNFKSYKGLHTIRCSPYMNFFVGNNNCGKTTIFQAVNFIQSGGDKEQFATKGITGELYVEIEFRGTDIRNIIDSTPDLAKYQSYICSDEKGDYIRIKRSSEENTVVQNKKPKNLGIRQVRIFNPEESQFENPTGIDKTISALFDAQFIWADSNNDEFHDFSKTKILGRLINEATNNFRESPTWIEFEKAHQKAFGQNAEGSITTQLEPIERRIESILQDQYGEVEVTFNFSLPQLDTFFKTGNVDLSDNGITTESTQKGTGLQRALALALMQVYAGIDSVKKEDTQKPFLFFLDEPETFLHPQAQNKLLEALIKLSQKSQIFITTHSPYLLRNFNSKKHRLCIFSHAVNSSSFSECTSLNTFPIISPTWGEINYFAFGVTSIEFHNELFGSLHALLKSHDESKYSRISSVDVYLAEEGNCPRDYKRFDDRGFDPNALESKWHPIREETLPVHIRNLIDHPEAIGRKEEALQLCEKDPEAFRTWANNQPNCNSIEEIKELTNEYKPELLKKSTEILLRVYQQAKQQYSISED